MSIIPQDLFLTVYSKHRSMNISKARIITIVLCLAGFILMAIFLKTGLAHLIDKPVCDFFYGLRSNSLNAFVSKFTLLGNWQTIIALCLLFLIIPRTRFKIGLPISTGALFVTIVNKLIKISFQRPRPDEALRIIEESGFSYTSGHSITSMFFYGFLLWLTITCVENRPLKIALTVLLSIPMIGIGISRIYCGVHYPTDVIGGWCLGLTTLRTLTSILKKKELPDR